MPTYVALVSWTEQGIRDYRDTVQRARSFSDTVSQAGGKVRELLWTFGEYDIVTVLEAPDDETVMATLLQVGAMGNVRTRTMRAMTAEEVDGVIGRAT